MSEIVPTHLAVQGMLLRVNGDRENVMGIWNSDRTTVELPGLMMSHGDVLLLSYTSVPEAS